MSERSDFRLSPVQRGVWNLDPSATVALTVEASPAFDEADIVERLHAAAAAKDVLGVELVERPELSLPRQRATEERRVVMTGPPAGERGDATAGAARIEMTWAGAASGGRLTLAAPALFLDLPSLRTLALEVLGRRAAAPAPPLEQVARWQDTLRPGEPQADAAVAAWRDVRAPAAWGFPMAARRGESGHGAHVVAMRLAPEGQRQVDALLDSGLSGHAVVAGAVHGLARLLNGERPWATAHVVDGRPFEDLVAAIAPLATAVPLLIEADATTSFESYAALAGEALAAARTHELFAHLADGSRERLSGQLVTSGAEGVTVVAARAPVVESLLRLSLIGDPGRGWRAQIEADAGRLSPLAAEALSKTAAHVLDRWLEDPSRSIAAGAAAWNPPAAPKRRARSLAPRRVAASVVSAAAETPSRCAIADVSQEVDFRTLERWSRSLAARIENAGVARRQTVAIAAYRRVETVVAMLAALRAGVAYVPIDPLAPAAYAQALVDAAGCVATLGDEADLPVGLTPIPVDGIDEEERPEPAPPASDEPAYILFTSGSSGRPKGVVVPHRALDSLCEGVRKAVYDRHERAETVAVNAPFTFDASVKQLCALAWGATVRIVPDDCRSDPRAFTAHLRQVGASCVDCTPTQLRPIAAAGLLDALPDLVLVGGERISSDLWDQLATARATFYNVYGLTEAADVSATARIEAPGDIPTIGSALPGSFLTVVSNGGDCPPGIPGELYVSGPSVADGYLATALSSEPSVDRFFERSGTRVLRTGDLVRRLTDDAIEYLGRIDRQIKLRGVRVEPAEVEQALREHPGVADVVADLVSLPDGRTALAAVVVPARPGSLELLGKRTIDLGDGLVVAHVNRHESEYLREEILRGPGYLRNGLRLGLGGMVLDVGSNIGLAGLAFHRAAAGVRVLGFEPVPQLAAIANANFRAHGVAGSVRAIGLGPKDERAELAFYPGYSIMSSRFADPVAEERTVRRFIANRVAHGDGDAALLDHIDVYLEGRFAPDMVTCEFRRLSSVLGELDVDRISVLKIDAQKSERGVLDGIDPSDFEQVEQVTMEVHDFDDNVDAVRALLDRHGFTCRTAQDEELAGTDRWHLTAIRSRVVATPPGRLPEGPPVISTASLRSALAERLPNALRPTLLVFADRIPRTSNGKFDVDAVARLAREQHAAIGETEPSTPAEVVLAAIFQRWLGLDAISLDDNFYELGGDSILQIQIAADAVAQGLTLFPKDFVTDPTIRALARIAASRPTTADAAIAPGGGSVDLSSAERERLVRELAAGQDPW